MFIVVVLYTCIYFSCVLFLSRAPLKIYRVDSLSKYCNQSIDINQWTAFEYLYMWNRIKNGVGLCVVFQMSVKQNLKIMYITCLKYVIANP